MCMWWVVWKMSLWVEVCVRWVVWSEVCGRWLVWDEVWWEVRGEEEKEVVCEISQVSGSGVRWIDWSGLSQLVVRVHWVVREFSLWRWGESSFCVFLCVDFREKRLCEMKCCCRSRSENFSAAPAAPICTKCRTCHAKAAGNQRRRNACHANVDPCARAKTVAGDQARPAACREFTWAGSSGWQVGERS